MRLLADHHEGACGAGDRSEKEVHALRRYSRLLGHHGHYWFASTRLIHAYFEF
jgi:hypothetical protein